MELITTIVWNSVFLIVALGILVGIHEYGHFAVARLFGVRVLRFSIGFGKVIWSKHDSHGTEFALSVLPLGGYVSMLGEVPEALEGLPEEERSRALPSKPAWQRLLIAFAGPAVNLLFAVLVYWMIHMLGNERPAPYVNEPALGTPAAVAGITRNERIVAIDGETTRTWREALLTMVTRIGDTGELAVTTETRDGQRRDYLLPIFEWLAAVKDPDPLAELGFDRNYLAPIIGVVVADSPAANSGLETGDLILSARGEPIYDWQGLVTLIRESPDSGVTLDVQRGTGTIQLFLTPERHSQGHGYAGIGLDLVATHYGPLAAIPAAVSSTWEFSVLTLSFLKKMLFGQLSLDNIGGPLTIADVAGSAALQGVKTFLHLLALLSITLGVLNLLPIPVLDGGHILYNGVEMIIRRPLPEKIQQIGMRVGLAMVLAFMAIALVNDFVRYVIG